MSRRSPPEPPAIPSFKPPVHPLPPAPPPPADVMVEKIELEPEVPLAAD